METLKTIGGALILSLLPTLLLIVWGDPFFWTKIVITQIVAILFIMLITKTHED